MEELSEQNLIRILGIGTAFILLVIVIVGLDFEVCCSSQCVVVVTIIVVLTSEAVMSLPLLPFTSHPG